MRAGPEERSKGTERRVRGNWWGPRRWFMGPLGGDGPRAWETHTESD